MEKKGRSGENMTLQKHFPALHEFLEKMRTVLERPVPNPDRVIPENPMNYLQRPDSGFKNALFLEGVEDPTEMRFYGQVDRELSVSKGEAADTVAMVKISKIFDEFKGRLASEGHAVRVANRGGYVHIHLQGTDSKERFDRYIEAHRLWNRPLK